MLAELHALVQRLPAASRLAVAMAEDDELVKGIDPSKVKSRGPALATYTPEAQRLPATVRAKFDSWSASARAAPSFIARSSTVSPFGSSRPR